MTKEELKRIIEQDPYHVARKNPQEHDIRLYLREVNYTCPLCGTELQSRRQKKLDEKQFEIAHIYPNSPTKEQYIVLKDAERLGETCESFENKIALCFNCHHTQDFHTTLDEYNKLVIIKKACLERTALCDAIRTLGLEDEIYKLIQALVNMEEQGLHDPSYEPVSLTNKFESHESLLKAKVSGYVTAHYNYIKKCLHDLDGVDNMNFEIISQQIKTCFIKMNDISTDKSMIFDKIVEWLMNKTQVTSKEACESLVSFFIQNCEVFYEITK